MWQGTGKSLDVINDDQNNKLQLANTDNYSIQYWKSLFQQMVISSHCIFLNNFCQIL